MHKKKPGSLLGQIIILYTKYYTLICMAFSNSKSVSLQTSVQEFWDLENPVESFGDFAGSFLGFSRVFVLGNEITFDNIIIQNAKIEKSTHSENGQPRVSPPPPPPHQFAWFGFHHLALLFIVLYSHWLKPANNCYVL